MDNSGQIVIISIISAMFGGFAGAVFNYLVNRKKITAETKKTEAEYQKLIEDSKRKNKAVIERIEAETEKLRAETNQFSGNVKEIKTKQGEQKDLIKEIQHFLVRHLLTDHERDHLQKLSNKNYWPFHKDATTKFFFDELRNLRSIGLIEGHPNKGIRSLDREGGDINSHFQTTREGENYLNIYRKSNEQ